LPFPAAVQDLGPGSCFQHCGINWNFYIHFIPCFLLVIVMYALWNQTDL
jgi:hypothetical protein